jgi:hypothetical protein
VGTAEKPLYTLTQRAKKDLVARVQATVTKIHANVYGVLARMSYGALPYYLKWIETVSKIYRKNEAPICLWFDAFKHVLCETLFCQNECYLISDTLLRICTRISFHSANYLRL